MKIVLDVDEQGLKCLREAICVDISLYYEGAPDIKVLDAILLQIPEEYKDYTPTDEENEEFQDWNQNLMWDRKHFPSYFWRSILRAGRSVMRQEFVKKARQNDAINKQLFDDKENNFYK